MLNFPLIGEFRREQVQITRVGSTRRIVPEVEALIEQHWTQALQRPGIHLFDGPMLRLEGFEVFDGRLQLALSETSYKIFVGTNLSHAELADQYGREVLANPVGLSTLLLSSDGHLLMGRRNERVAYYPLRVHPFAGCLEPRDSADIFGGVGRELQEELSLTDDDLADLCCMGIAEDLSLRQPEMIFVAEARRTLGEIASRLDEEEHRGVFAAPASREGVEAALKADERFTPVGVAALLMWGGRRFGEAWFTEGVGRIRAGGRDGKPRPLGGR